MLPVVAILAGILTTLVIRHTTNARSLRDARNRIYGHLLEFRLFFDEPSLIWQAQLGLLRENARLVKVLLLPSLILAFPMTWLVLQLDTVYGLRPLRLDDPAIVTAQLTRPIETADRFGLQGVDGIMIETLPIRVPHDNQIVWRIRPARAADGAITLTMNGRAIRKTIVAGDSRKLLSPRRWRSAVKFLLHPEEPRLPDADIAWVEVEYPEGTRVWMLWFVVLATGAVLLSARWVGNQVN